jgi:hypothetical protein
MINSSTTYDVAIIGGGVAGAFCLYKIAKEYGNDCKTILFESSRPPGKRRPQMQGWLGCYPSSDGKLYLNDIQKIANIVGLRKTKSAFNYFKKIMNNVDLFPITRDKGPSISLSKKIKKAGFSTSLNDYIQTYPKNVHALSKFIANVIEIPNIECMFDTEVTQVFKQKDEFVIIADDQEYRCKKLIISVGRSGWYWARNLYKSFGIIDNNDSAKFGIKVEMNSLFLKDFNKSPCTLNKDNLEIGPFNWEGTVIPEDHVEMVITSFRANENRWLSDKVSFNIIGNRYFENKGFEQVDRIGKLIFILSNDRVVKEKVSNIIANKSRLSILPEFNWMSECLNQMSIFIPDIINKAYFYIPTLIPSAPKINIGKNFESEIENMFILGESAGVNGLLSAALMGIMGADFLCKK